MARLQAGDTAAAQKVKLAPVEKLLKGINMVKWKLEIILQLCDALQYLHRFHMLHRDIKYPNVMLFHDMNANKVIAKKIGDFGLALTVDIITRTTAGGTTAPNPLLGRHAQRGGSVQLHGPGAV